MFSFIPEVMITRLVLASVVPTLHDKEDSDNQIEISAELPPCLEDGVDQETAYPCIDILEDPEVAVLDLLTMLT